MHAQHTRRKRYRMLLRCSKQNAKSRKPPRQASTMSEFLMLCSSTKERATLDNDCVVDLMHAFLPLQNANGWSCISCRVRVARQLLPQFGHPMHRCRH